MLQVCIEVKFMGLIKPLGVKSLQATQHFIKRLFTNNNDLRL